MMRKDMLLTVIAACSLGLLTTGCSTIDKVVNGDERMVEIEESKVADLQIPAWFLQKEINNSKVLTVVATDVSKDMQFAIDKAELQAKVQLAQKIGTKVSSLVRESTLESGYGINDVESEIDRVSKAKTDQMIGFFRRENMKVVREGDYYRAYVMLRLDIEEGRRLTAKPTSEDRNKRFEALDQTTKVETVTITPVEVVSND
jgi:hypothetical protein